MSRTQALFAPFQNSRLTLKNRLVMAPMTRTHSPGGVPGQNVVDYYRRRAEGGVGLIITEGTTIDHPVASMHDDIPRFHGEAALAGWRRVVEAVHEAGGKICPQLWHVGTVREPGKGPNPELEPMGPSGMSKPGEKTAREMSRRDIEDVVNAFAKGARQAREIGFDGIELHGAHGYLIDQFFWEKLNQRSDHYAGSIENRSRFATEIVRAIRAEVGNDYPIILRFSQWKLGDYDAKLAHDPKELEAFLTPLVDAGVDIFHASQRRFWEPEFPDSSLNLAGWTKKLSGKPAITVGSVALDTDFMSSFRGTQSGSTGIDDLLDRLEQCEFDLVAVGRALIADPAWGEKIRRGIEREIKTFTPEALQTLY